MTPDSSLVGGLLSDDIVEKLVPGDIVEGLVISCIMVMTGGRS